MLRGHAEHDLAAVRLRDLAHARLGDAHARELDTEVQQGLGHAGVDAAAAGGRRGAKGSGHWRRGRGGGHDSHGRRRSRGGRGGRWRGGHGGQGRGRGVGGVGVRGVGGGQRGDRAVEPGQDARGVLPDQDRGDLGPRRPDEEPGHEGGHEGRQRAQPPPAAAQPGRRRVGGGGVGVSGGRGGGGGGGGRRARGPGLGASRWEGGGGGGRGRGAAHLNLLVWATRARERSDRGQLPGSRCRNPTTMKWPKGEAFSR